MAKLLLSVVLIVFTLSYTTENPVKARNKNQINSVKQPEGCVCEKFSCGCCVYMDVPQIWLNDTACINFAYDPIGYGISFTITIDDTTLINETISARNPPPICFPVPLIEDFVDGCVHFYDLNISNTDFHGCVQLEIRMWWVFVVAEVKLGCFDTNGLLKNKSKNEVSFPNVQVNNKSRYEVLTMQGKQVNDTLAVGVHLLEDLQINHTSIKEMALKVMCEKMLSSKSNLVGVHLIEDSQINHTQVNETYLKNMCGKKLTSKSNLVEFSPYLLVFFIVIMFF